MRWIVCVLVSVHCTAAAATTGIGCGTAAAAKGWNAIILTPRITASLLIEIFSWRSTRSHRVEVTLWRHAAPHCVAKHRNGEEKHQEPGLPAALLASPFITAVLNYSLARDAA